MLKKDIPLLRKDQWAGNRPSQQTNKFN